MRSDPPEELLRQLRQAGEAVLFCHVAPDGDTLGSARAMELLLPMLRCDCRVSVLTREPVCGAAEKARRLLTNG